LTESTNASHREERPQSVDHDLFNDLIANSAYRAGPRFIHQSIETIVIKPFTPLRYRRRAAANLGSDLMSCQVRV